MKNLHPIFQQAIAPFVRPAEEQPEPNTEALDELGGSIVEADKRLQAAQKREDER